MTTMTTAPSTETNPTTWIGPEEHAYNTYAGGHSGSGRRGAARFPDGQIRRVILGVPDTFYTIPAHGRMNGRYVSGFVSMDTESGEYRMTIQNKRAEDMGLGDEPPGVGVGPEETSRRARLAFRD